MGVKLSDIITAQNVDFNFFKGKVLAIDFSNMCYQFLSSIRSPDGMPLSNSNGDVTSHLLGITSRIPPLLSFGIKPIFVFDGEPPALKTRERERRRDLKKRAEDKLQKAREDDDHHAVSKYARQTIRITDDIIDSAKKLFTALGLPVVQSPCESDAQGAYLVKTGQAYCVASTDFDNLLFGATRMVTNLTLSSKRRLPSGAYVKNELKLFELSNVLKSLALNQKQLIALGILVGTDYNPGGVFRIGPKKALALVKDCKDFDGMFSKLETNFDWHKVMDVFENMEVDKDVSIKFNDIDKELLDNLLVKKFEFSEERVSKLISMLEHYKKQNNQSSLSDWSN
ncbi:flap endonuclease-1 [archaeon]|nr:flap endonuclease-1 [archaeon]|tara:strand:+ start:974 stop:1993 length:1020 start_codon:yes stop_codon:yes gene_type:complete